MRDEARLIGGAGSRAFTTAVAAELGVPVLRAETLRVSDANPVGRILDNVRGRHVFVVQSVSYPVNDTFVELLFWLDAARRASAAEVTAVIPFFGYAKGDKKDEPRVSTTVHSACAPPVARRASPAARRRGTASRSKGGRAP